MKKFEIDVTVSMEVPDHYEPEDAIADLQFVLPMIRGCTDMCINSVVEESK